jgi:archaellum component FlaF (FlaF/FlaG flagellin family)
MVDRSRLGRHSVVAVTLALAATSTTPALAGSVTDSSATTSLVSLGNDGSQGNGDSFASAISAHGRYVAFASSASNLVPGDTNGFADIFLRDRLAGTTRLVSVSATGGPADNFSVMPAISADGRYVAWESGASNLVSGDTNGVFDVFVRDMVTGHTIRASLGTNGQQGNGNSQRPALSADGRYVAFESVATNLVSGDTNAQNDVFVRDLASGTTQRVSVGIHGQGNSGSYEPAISASGRYVSFASLSSNLVAGDTNFVQDVFVRDRQQGTTSRVSVSTFGVQGNEASGLNGSAISADGRFVAFASRASNLAGNDSNREDDVFVRDRANGITKRVSLSSDGRQGNAVSGDEQRVGISADGRYVAYFSFATNLVPGDTNGVGDIFVRDRATGVTTRVSVGPGGAQANFDGFDPGISADGQHVVWVSRATNLVDNDTNAAYDVFTRDAAFTG